MPENLCCIKLLKESTANNTNLETQKSINNVFTIFIIYILFIYYNLFYINLPIYQKLIIFKSENNSKKAY